MNLGYSLSQYRERGCSRIRGGVVRAGLFKRVRAECSRKSKKQAKRRKRWVGWPPSYQLLLLLLSPPSAFHMGRSFWHEHLTSLSSFFWVTGNCRWKSTPHTNLTMAWAWWRNCVELCWPRLSRGETVRVLTGLLPVVRGGRRPRAASDEDILAGD